MSRWKCRRIPVLPPLLGVPRAGGGGARRRPCWAAACWWRRARRADMELWWVELRVSRIGLIGGYSPCDTFIIKRHTGQINSYFIQNSLNILWSKIRYLFLNEAGYTVPNQHPTTAAMLTPAPWGYAITNIQANGWYRFCFPLINEPRWSFYSRDVLCSMFFHLGSTVTYIHEL